MLDLGTLQIGVKVDDAAAKTELNQLGGEVERTGGKTDTLASKAKLAMKAFVAAYAVKEIAKLGKAALDAFADFEQLEGGVEKIFGKEAAETVMRNAEEAYKTAGLSANQYMETVTSFSASLIQSLEGDTEAAAEIADMAIRDMSDNANTFGTNMQSIQDAYQGFAKQNYSMLDNLKLGYGGSRQEMERLLKDAEKLTGKKYDISNLNDVYEAIHAIQEEYNITGTTANEASQTVSGSINTMKSAWENMLTAMGRGKGVDKAVNKLLDSIGTVAKNIAPVALNILKSLVKGLVKAVPKVIGMLGQMMSSLADAINNSDKGSMAKAAVGMIKNLVAGLIRNIPTLIVGAVKLVVALAKGIIQARKELLKAGLKLITEMVKGFTKGHPKIKKAITTLGKVFKTVFKPIIKIIQTVIDIWKKFMGLKASKKFSISAPFKKAIETITNVYDKWKDVLGQTAKKTFSVAKKGFETVINAMKKVYDWWKKILGQKSKKTYETEHQNHVGGGGGHAKRIGLREVPYDGYEAILHKGEAIMTAAEVNKLNKRESVTGGGNAFTVNVYGSNNMSVNELAAAVERRIINLQKRRTEAWA